MQEKNRYEKQPLYSMLALIGAIIALTISPLFVRWANAPGIITSFYRMSFATIFLSIFLFPRIKDYKFQDPKHVLFPILAGLFSAIDHSLWAIAINQTSVANATVLNNISPLWVAVFSFFIWHENLGWKFWVGLVVVFIGSALVMGNSIIFQLDYMNGDILAFSSSFFMLVFFFWLNVVERIWILLFFYIYC